MIEILHESDNAKGVFFVWQDNAAMFLLSVNGVTCSMGTRVMPARNSCMGPCCRLFYRKTGCFEVLYS